MTMETTAKIFKNGRSQAVRLPKEFRFEGDAVKIKKEGKKVILEPLENSKWPRGFWNLFTPDQGFDIPRPLLSKPVDLDNR
jgi:virulence-associated protein VagC